MQEHEPNKEVLLRRINYALDTLIDAREADMVTASIQDVITHQIESLIVTLNRSVWKEEKPEKVFTYPDGWTEAVKERWAPGWFKKRYPVKVKSVTVTCDVIYPGLIASLPDEQSVVKMRIREGKSYL